AIRRFALENRTRPTPHSSTVTQTNSPVTTPPATRPAFSPSTFAPRPSIAPTSNPQTHPTDRGSGYLGPAPMDLSAIRKPLSPEERARRVREGLCFYCGSSSHGIGSCPLNRNPRPPRPRVQANEASLSPVTVVNNEPSSATTTSTGSEN